MLFGAKWLFFIIYHHITTESTDDEDDYTQYTKSAPPPKVVDVPNILIHPVENTPSQGNNDIQYDYPIIIASPQEIATDSQPDVSTGLSDSTLVQAPVNLRPRRNIKPPKYLNDYVLKWSMVFLLPHLCWIVIRYSANNALFHIVSCICIRFQSTVKLCFLRKECTLHFFHRREEERKEKSRHVRVAGYATVITVADILINS